VGIGEYSHYHTSLWLALTTRAEVREFAYMLTAAADSLELQPRE
jgi:hypothetical protein